MKTPEQILEAWPSSHEDITLENCRPVVQTRLLELIHLAQAEERKRCLSILNSACAITECEDYAAVAEEIEKGE
jgi:hypothetical protein